MFTILYLFYSTLLCFALFFYQLLSLALPYFTLLYFTLLYFTLLYFTLLYFTLLYFTLLYFTLLYFTLLYNTLIFNATLLYLIYIPVGLCRTFVRHTIQLVGVRDVKLLVKSLDVLSVGLKETTHFSVSHLPTLPI